MQTCSPYASATTPPSAGRADRWRAAVRQVDTPAAIVSAFALTHTPQEVQFYGLDFGGGGMSAVAGLPHVGEVASRLDPEQVRRTVAEVYGVMTRREEYYRSAGIDSIATFRRMRARGDISVADQPWGDVFLVIDGCVRSREK